MGNYPYLKDTCEFSIHVENISFTVLVNQKLSDAPMQGTAVADAVDNTMHTHVYTELFYCVDGNIALKTTDGRLNIGKGELLVMPAGVQHVRLSGTGEWGSVGISFSKVKSAFQHDLYRMLNNLCKLDKPWRLSGQSRVCGEIYDLLNSKQQPCVLTLRLLEFLLQMCGIKQQYDLSDRNDTVMSADLNRVSQLERILSLSFMEDLRINEIAAQLFISERQLNRIVKAKFGTSFHKLLIQKRLSAACYLLINTDMTVEEIGEEVGFGTKSAFYSAFQREFDMTPNAFRDKNRIAE